MNENRTRTNKNHPGASINWWKWSFISLIVIIVVAIGFLVNAIRPVSINEADTEPIMQTEEEMVLTTAVDKADAERIINTFLKEATAEDYTVQLTNQLEIIGTVKVFAFDVPFTLSFDPYVLENGNIQLRADSVQLASFSLPVSTVISILAEQLDVPSYIAIDSESQMIVVNLIELNEQTDMKVSMSKIDLENNDILIQLFVNEQNIIDAMSGNVQ